MFDKKFLAEENIQKREDVLKNMLIKDMENLKNIRQRNRIAKYGLYGTAAVGMAAAIVYVLTR